MHAQEENRLKFKGSLWAQCSVPYLSPCLVLLLEKHWPEKTENYDCANLKDALAFHIVAQ